MFLYDLSLSQRLHCLTSFHHVMQTLKCIKAHTHKPNVYFQLLHHLNGVVLAEVRMYKSSNAHPTEYEKCELLHIHTYLNFGNIQGYAILHTVVL